jgi:transposase
MSYYTEEFKSSIAARMLPPNNIEISDLAKETGIPKDTLYGWRAKYRNQNSELPLPGKSVDKFTAVEKMAIIIDTAKLNELELSEYCRAKGMYQVQIDNWKRDMILGYQLIEKRKAEPVRVVKDYSYAELEKEIIRKDKALAEVTALLVLQKKFHILVEGRKEN